MDHRGGHTLSTLRVQLCPSMTSCQYSDTPVSLTVFAKCIADSGRNTSSIITINREHDQDTGLRFRQAPYPDRNTGNGDCISVKYSNTSHVDQNIPDVRLMTESVIFTIAAQFEALPGLATWLPSRTLAAIHQSDKGTRYDATSQLLPSMRHSFNVGKFNSIHLTRVTSILPLSTSFW